MVKLYGATIDHEGRCVHYSSPVDVVANKCYSCKKYYACFQCHDEQEDHLFFAWPVSNEKIVLCGSCRTELSAMDYKTNTKCVNCGHLFNPNCALHSHIYFSEQE